MIARRVSYARRLSTLAPIAAVCLQLASTGVARGQEDTNAQETAAARALAVEGVKLAQAGQCKDALDKLDRSEKLRHSPIVLGHLGECQIALGKWVEGSENLRKLLRDPLPADASAALTQAYERATVALRDLKPRIPTVTVNVKAPRGVDVTLKVDGVEVSGTMIGVPMPADPGDHTLEIGAPGFLDSSSTVHLAAGAKETVTLELRRDPFATDAAPASPPAPAPARPAPAPTAPSAVLEPAPQSSSSGASKIAAYVSYGVGAVGLGVGLGFGRAAMQAEDDLSKRCPDKVCSPSERSDLDSAKTKGVISTIGFGVGAAGIALGTILLVTSGDSSPQTGAARPLKLRPRAAIGLGSVALGAAF